MSFELPKYYSLKYDNMLERPAASNNDPLVSCNLQHCTSVSSAERHPLGHLAAFIDISFSSKILWICKIIKTKNVKYLG